MAHPKVELIQVLVERLLAACALHEPRLRDVTVRGVVANYALIGDVWGRLPVPVHPEVAKGLGLRWYDSDERYPRPDGRRVSYREYVEEFIRYAMEHKLRRNVRAALDGPGRILWPPPVRGTALRIAASSGCYHDGFIGSSVEFDAVAAVPIDAITVHGYVPSQHAAPLTLTLAIGDGAPLVTRAAPDSAFAISVDAALAGGVGARLRLGVSSLFNPLQLGLNEDSRNLGVLLTAVEARPRREA